MSKPRAKSRQEETLARIKQGQDRVAGTPLFWPLYAAAHVQLAKTGPYTEYGLVAVTADGVILLNAKRRAEPGQWARAIAHGLLHLAMGHFVARKRSAAWNMACDGVVESFLSALKFGEPWYENAPPTDLHDEEKEYHRLGGADAAEKAEYAAWSTAGAKSPDMVFENLHPALFRDAAPDWAGKFAEGLARAVMEAVDAVGGREAGPVRLSARMDAARRWFMDSYPLLGALAAGFTIIEDVLICQRMDIQIAAVSPALSEIYVNPCAGLDADGLRFVLAHEFLHAALRHVERQEWRDEFLWNVACDFVLNQWLTEMGVGERPTAALYDEAFKGMSAEAVYDRITADLRIYRKLATLRGKGLGDIMPGAHGARVVGADLDAFYRRAIAQGLDYHRARERGFLPAGLIEEIRALAHPPIPWDVELARWFDEHFTPIEKTRSYARPSRRQSSVPDIPRPNWVVRRHALDGRTFGVVLDTSESMERGLLAAALRAIASYSAARDVPAARVVFCDAEAHDMGYMKPEDLAGAVQVKGRGGTRLQPGIDRLREADDFPADAPILLITDGECDVLALHGREHAFLIPRSAHLPFEPKGKVFRITL